MSLLTAGAIALNPASAITHGFLGGQTHRTGIFDAGRKILGEHLGKNLSHHQVVHAVNNLRTSNHPLIDIGKAVLSSTGGHPRIVNQALSNSKFTIPLSHFDRRQVAKSGVENQLKHSLSQVSNKSA